MPKFTLGVHYLLSIYRLVEKHLNTPDSANERRVACSGWAALRHLFLVKKLRIRDKVKLTKWERLYDSMQPESGKTNLMHWFENMAKRS